MLRACRGYQKITVPIGERFGLFMAGKYAQARDMHLITARSQLNRGLRKLFVDFARDAHHEYLHMLREVA